MINFQNSKYGIQCIGPCYKENEIYKHPITKEYITQKNHKTCPINPITETNTDGEDVIIKLIDKCEKVTSSEYNNLNVTDNIVNDFNCKLFLKNIYNIESFRDTINYINKNKLNIITEKRLLNCSWKAFGNNIDNLTTSIIKYYVNKINTKWKLHIIKYNKNFNKIDNDSLTNIITDYIDRI